MFGTTIHLLTFMVTTDSVTMILEDSVKSQQLRKKVKEFMQRRIFPLENAHASFVREHPWKVFPEIEVLKNEAKASNLWNLFLPLSYGSLSPGLTNLEYAPIAEAMGKVLWASEVFNCSAPDTGNMEVLAKYGNQAQQHKWLQPLLDGTIRSAFLMTEPDVASSDATNIQTSITREGDHYIVSGRKWWSSGAMHPSCRLYIVMGKTDPKADRHRQQSMILIPADSPGIKVVRPLPVYGNWDSPEGHAEVLLHKVKVPVENLLVGEGEGFAIAQGRLGPGRIHHCMRLVGTAQRAMDLMCQRVTERKTFGKEISQYSSIRQDIAKSRCEIEQARLLTLATAEKIDRKGNKEARDLIAMIKIVVPAMACRVVDRAIQAHGGLGVSEDTPLAGFWRYARTMRIADGPDEVHMYQLGRNTIKSFASEVH